MKQMRAVVQHRPPKPNHRTDNKTEYSVKTFHVKRLQTDRPKVPESAGPIAKPKQKATSPMA